MTATWPGSGRPSKISPRTTRAIINQVKANPNITSRDLQSSLAAPQVTVCASTTITTLNPNAIHGRVARKKPLLSKKNQTAHLNFARDHLDKPEVKHGDGNDKIWGCFSSSGPGRLHIIKGTIHSEVYQVILEQNVRPSVKELKLGMKMGLPTRQRPKRFKKIYQTMAQEK
uniref:Transposase Tc1-like domain-containing protein n=1 Tax=Oncorhynchus tshawytscha TaxID=74940 RepID=A0AAZ3NSK7_ONCTS